MPFAPNGFETGQVWQSPHTLGKISLLQEQFLYWKSGQALE